MTSIMLSVKDGNASRKIDILAAFEDTMTNREIVLYRVMSCKTPIHAEKWDNVVKDQDQINTAFYQLCTYLNEFNSQMTNTTSKTAPAQHAIAEPNMMMTGEVPLVGSQCITCSLSLLKSISRNFWILCSSTLVSTSRANASGLLQAFWQKSGNDSTFILFKYIKKSRTARFWNTASVAKIWQPDISSVQETALSGILYEFFVVFIVAKTRCLELATNNLLTRTHS